ncbi:MAG: NUDIX hydrolase [Candidatus Paceibacterota bacterium]
MNNKKPVLTTDGLITKGDKILLIKRDIEPFKGFWVLPGGHVEYNEKVEQAIRREVKEELGVNVKIKNLVGVYSDPERDPRYHSVSVAFYLKKTGGEFSLNEEATTFEYFHFENLPRKVGFDHRKIIKDLEK